MGLLNSTGAAECFCTQMSVFTDVKVMRALQLHSLLLILISNSECIFSSTALHYILNYKDNCTKSNTVLNES